MHRINIYEDFQIYTNAGRKFSVTVMKIALNNSSFMKNHEGKLITKPSRAANTYTRIYELNS